MPERQSVRIHSTIVPPPRVASPSAKLTWLIGRAGALCWYHPPNPSLSCRRITTQSWCKTKLSYADAILWNQFISHSLQSALPSLPDMRIENHTQYVAETSITSDFEWLLHIRGAIECATFNIHHHHEEDMCQLSDLMVATMRPLMSPLLPQYREGLHLPRHRWRLHQLHRLRAWGLLLPGGLVLQGRGGRGGGGWWWLPGSGSLQEGGREMLKA